MTILQSFILGIVEGVTEFLPISSTGHLILASELLKIGQSNFTKSFEIIIQLGAVLSVVVLYWKSFWNRKNIKKLIVAFIPTGIVGLVLYKIVKTYLMGNLSVVLWSLLVGGIVIIIFEYWHRRPFLHGEPGEEGKGISEVSYKQSFLVGLFQAVSIIPGVSRAAATIVGGLAIGLKRKTIVEFSFLLAVPTMLGATALDLAKNGDSFSKDQFFVLAVGFAVSFAVAMASIKFLLNFIKKHSFVPFGVYRIALAIAFWILVLK